MNSTNSRENTLDRLAVDTIRTLSMDAVQKANSGHPGTPMALAPVIYSLWQDSLRYDPENPHWFDRDRFVLSCGHASMLLYSTLHLAGVKQLDAKGAKTGNLAVPLEEIQKFRQLDSLCPGHPEFRWTTGVETTTGPLGQGIANSVGMAIASRWLGARYNKPGFDVFTHRVFALCSDGDLMEGVASEAASIAGHLALSNLCWIYDNNKITIEGETDLAFTEDVATRFVGMGWNVTRVVDANDRDMLKRALGVFAGERTRPTLIIVDSHIGYGAPKKQDSHAAHGEPLGDDEIKATKKVYGWPEDAKFLVPDGVREQFAAGVGTRGAKLHSAWKEMFARYEKENPKLAAEIGQIQRGELPSGWAATLPTFPADAKGMATRDAGGKAINAVAQAIPWLVGGSADLAPSTKTKLTFDGAGDLDAQTPGGRNMHFGIREHAMSSIANGMALTGLRSFGATFLIFSDYMRPTLRLASLMEIAPIYVFTHDSIGVGEDGPTHQPIEMLASLRAIPGVTTIRPCDANETSEAWKAALENKHGPTCLALTRQALPTIDRTKFGAATGLHKGAYVLADAKDGHPQVILIATGSEVALCMAAWEKLTAEGIETRVVSMPSFELFERQTSAYRASVLPLECTARVAVEMASPFGWSRWIGDRGATVCMTGFGASAPLPDLLKKFGFTVDNVVATAKKQLSSILT
ncbi:MAG: transketolase [Planctomycetota bacterium]|nr:transketolase [Planctomycetota bacterium]